MTNNYIRGGPPLDCQFIFFDTNDQGSLERAKNKLSELEKARKKGPYGIWTPHPLFPQVPPIGR